MAIVTHQFRQALFAEFSEFVFGLGDTIAVGQEDLAGMSFRPSLLLVAG